MLFARYREIQGNNVRVRNLKAAILLLPLTAASVHAQPQSATPKPRSPLAEIAHDISTWLSSVTTSGPNHHRASSSIPLPRPRPWELTPAPLASNNKPSELTPAPLISSNKASEFAPAPVVSNKQPLELAPAPIAPKKKISAPVLIN